MPGPGTTFEGPIFSGTNWNYNPVANLPANTGTVQLAQVFGPFTPATTATAVLFSLPAGTIIHDIEVDIATATTGTLTVDVGLTSGGTDYAAFSIAAGSGRNRWTPTAADVTNAYNQNYIPVNQPLYITYSATTAVGSFYVTIEYLQTVQQYLGVI